MLPTEVYQAPDGKWFAVLPCGGTKRIFFWSSFSGKAVQFSFFEGSGRLIHRSRFTAPLGPTTDIFEGALTLEEFEKRMEERRATRVPGS
jgi:xanthine/CO dehydrogenase XdhC/CoxF family maturation factor